MPGPDTSFPASPSVEFCRLRSPDYNAGLDNANISADIFLYLPPLVYRSAFPLWRVRTWGPEPELRHCRPSLLVKLWLSKEASVRKVSLD